MNREFCASSALSPLAIGFLLISYEPHDSKAQSTSWFTNDDPCKQSPAFYDLWTAFCHEGRSGKGQSLNGPFPEPMPGL